MASIASNPSTTSSAPSASIIDQPIGDSPFLQKIKYDSATLQLTVTMKSGGEYVYFYVFPATVDQLLQAPSKGKFYSENIKGKNPSSKLIDKNVGPQVRPLAKGPVHEEKKPRRTHGRATATTHR